MKKLNYLSKIPATTPAGHVSAHNHVKPKRHMIKL